MQQPNGSCNSWSQLESALTNEQREQLATLVLSRLKFGWGSIEIIIKDYHLKEFRDTHTIPAIKPQVDS